MPSPTEITVSQLSRLIGLPGAPAVVDVRIEEDYAADPRLMPGSRRRDYRDCQAWASAYQSQTVVVSCQKGLKLSQGVAALMRNDGIDAQTLEGGFEAWKAGGQLLVRTDKLPARDDHGRTVWVTRARPKIDRIACPWLIRRFVDPVAVFLFVAPSEVLPVAERFNATPFDVDGVFWSHRGQTLHLRHHARGVPPQVGPAATARHDRSGRRYVRPQPRAAGSRPARSFARALPHVPGRSCPARGRHGALRCLLSMVPRCRRGDAQLAVDQGFGLRGPA